jgi:hypothetical protein
MNNRHQPLPTPPPVGSRYDPSTKSDAPSSPEQIKADFESCNMTLLGVPLTKEEITQTI